MNLKNIGLVLIIGVSIVLSVIALNKPVPQADTDAIAKSILSQLGGSSSQNHDFLEFFNNGLFSSGFSDQNASVPTMIGPALTATSSDICNNTILNMQSPTGTRVTLPSMVSFMANGNCLSRVGDTKVIFFTNDSVGTSTFAKGASSSISYLALNSSANSSSTMIGSSTAMLIGRVRASSTTEKFLNWTGLLFSAPQ